MRGRRKRERGWDEEEDSQRGGREREKGDGMKTARWVGGWLVQTRTPVMTDTNGRNIELGFCCHNKGGGW